MAKYIKILLIDNTKIEFDYNDPLVNFFKIESQWVNIVYRNGTAKHLPISSILSIDRFEPP